MNRKSVASLLVLFISAAGVLALPKVAVLQTTVAAGIDPTIEPAITGKMEEALVNSGRYQVLDRVSVAQVLREKEFQVTSGMVSEAEMRRAGEYLGADFVVVVNVSRVGQTFVLSAKMVDVQSGQIAGQASSDRQGTIDVLLALAVEASDRIAGKPAAAAKAASQKGGASKAAEAAEDKTPPPFYRHTVEMEYLRIPWEDAIGVGYSFRFTPLFGVLGDYDATLDATRKMSVFGLGAFMSLNDWLDLGARGIYIVNPSGTAGNYYDYPSGLGYGALLRMRFGRFALKLFVGVSNASGNAMVIGGAGLGASY